jgi:hypothetical protein
MATTTGGLPYPVGTDKIVDGDDAIKALAEAVDARVPWRMTANLSTWGVPGANAGVSAALTFPVGRFTQTPIVVVTADSTGYLAGSSGGVTSAGFTGRVFNLTAGVPGGVNLKWIAVQFLPGASPGLAALFDALADTTAAVFTDPRTLVVICHTDGCGNAGIPVELVVDGAEELAFVACGVCSQRIDDVS